MPVMKYSYEEKKSKYLVGNIKKRQSAEQITDGNMAQYLGLSVRSYRQRLNDPDMFKYSEIVKTFKRLGFTDEEIRQSVQGEAMKGLIQHKNTIVVSGSLSFFLTSLPIWEFVNKFQRAGAILLFTVIIYALLWLEGDR